jgi:pSer/pThr/pTyr-binding forkhead associated (FHA) protein
MRYRVRADGRGALLGEGELVVGRSSYCSLVLDHPSVSRVHAAIRLSNGRIEISDLESSNGTYVRGRRVLEPTTIEPGDEIRLGSQPIAVEIVKNREAADTSRRGLESFVPDHDTEFETIDTVGPGQSKTLGPAKSGSGKR